MNNRQHNLNPLVKRILIGLGVIILSATLTVVVVNVFFKPTSTKVTNSQTTPSAADMIKKYTDGYKLDGYTINKSNSDSIIAYKLSDTAYTVQISSLNNVQFTKSDNSTADDITRATDNTKTFLINSGFTKVSNPVYSDPTQLLYDSQNTVCKIFNSFDPAQKTSSYGLVCADKPVFVAERNSIKTLLDLYIKSGGANDFKNIVRTTYSEDNKVLSLLAITPQNASKAPYTLIFAAIDGKWSYIGSRVTPSIDVQDSFQLSDSLKAAVNDPKYGGFLAKYIY